MALNVVLPELLLPPPMVIVILLLIPRYNSRVLPAARLRKIDSHCVVMPSPADAMPSSKVPHLRPIMIELE